MLRGVKAASVRVGGVHFAVDLGAELAVNAGVICRHGFRRWFRRICRTVSAEILVTWSPRSNCRAISVQSFRAQGTMCGTTKTSDLTRPREVLRD
jgi:hypothetical protein